MEEEVQFSLSRKTRTAKRLEVIIPTLNEEATIKRTIENIRQESAKLPIETSILVIDANSKDKTVELCSNERGVEVILQKGRGKGNAMREGIEHTNAEIALFIDGDGTYSASNIEQMIEPLLNGAADMVVGSRTLGKREKGSISVLNYVGNKIFNALINFAMKSRVTDSLSGYRALYRKAFKELVLFSDSFEIEVEMTVEAIAKGFRVIEVPVDYRTRKGMSITKLNPLGDGFRIARTLLFVLMNVNPIKFFSIIALSFLLAGLYPTSYILMGLGTAAEVQSLPALVLASLLFVTGAISFVVGLLAELVVRSRRRIEHLISRKT